MHHPLRRLLLGLIAALLLLQPAVRAGAACASSLFTGTCPCTAAADEVATDTGEASTDTSESDCCAPSQSTIETDATGEDSSEPSRCGCTAETAPELPAAPRTSSVGAGQPGVLEHIQVAFLVALPEFQPVRAVEASRPPGRDADLLFARGPTTARRLAALQVLRR